MNVKTTCTHSGEKVEAHPVFLVVLAPGLHIAENLICLLDCGKQLPSSRLGRNVKKSGERSNNKNRNRRQTLEMP